MNKARAIKLHCLDCAGGSAHEVTLCEITDCPLWEHRLGCSTKSQVYQKRFNKALAAHPERAREQTDDGVDVPNLPLKHALQALPGTNAPRVGVDDGGNAEAAPRLPFTSYPGQLQAKPVPGVKVPCASEPSHTGEKQRIGK